MGVQVDRKGAQGWYDLQSYLHLRKGILSDKENEIILWPQYFFSPCHMMGMFWCFMKATAIPS